MAKRRWTPEDLLALRERLVSLYPYATADRARTFRAAIDRIDRKLGMQPRPTRRELLEADDAPSGVRGVGGLDFVVQAPPGRGRLIRVPMFLTQTPGVQVISGGVLGGLSTTNPVCIGILTATATLTGIRLQTQQVTWANYRIVGFQVLQLGTSTSTTLTAVHSAIARPSMLVKNLVPGGGVNLFPHGNYIDATVYDVSIPELVGLRDDPVVDATNTVTVDVAITGVAQDVATDPQRLTFDPQRLTFAAWLVGEVVEDTIVGAPIPGPYARRDALLRTWPAEAA